KVFFRRSLKMSSVEALVDYFPFDSGFRLTGGVMFNNNDFTGSGKPNVNGLVEIGGYVFTADTVGQVDAEVEVRRIAPYLGVSYGNTFKGSALSVNADLGVMFLGRPDATVRVSGADNASPFIRNRLNEAARNEEGDVEDQLDRLQYYPLVRVGLTYAF
ncbi:hypothetical protein, partial [Pseudomonas saliphila]|uniref:hypothetical protein n=1 Tax=Pseudomonas saliphila TaxID=2586906 RepID=UPI0019D671F1